LENLLDASIKPFSEVSTHLGKEVARYSVELVDLIRRNCQKDVVAKCLPPEYRNPERQSRKHIASGPGTQTRELPDRMPQTGECENSRGIHLRRVIV
jgi:hypothetical protein